MSAPLEVHAASATDVGRVREGNEDACFSGTHVFAVADGLGGHRGGEVASNLALESIAPLDALDPKRAAEKIGEAVRSANRTVSQRAGADSQLAGMGTTMTAVVISADTAHLAHVGDSRCYLIRGSGITRLSRDHTLVARMVEEGKITQEQAEVHPQRSILTRALGAEREVEVDEVRFSLVPGDRLVLCSDGLTAVLSDDEIKALATDGADLREICARLIDEANARGGPDNVTVVVVDLAGAPGVVPAAKRSLPVIAQRARGGRPSWERRRVPVRALVWTTAVLVLIVGGFIAVKTVTDRSYYVGIKNGQVAIFRGVPVEVGSARLASVQEPTTIPTGDIAAWYLPRLEQGIPADSLEDARRIIAEQIPAAPGKTIDGALPGPSPTGASPTGTGS